MGKPRTAPAKADKAIALFSEAHKSLNEAIDQRKAEILLHEAEAQAAAQASAAKRADVARYTKVRDKVAELVA